MLPTALYNLVNYIARRSIYIVLFVIVGLGLVLLPNPIAHECIPDANIQANVTQLGYNHDRYFCGDGTYPRLRWSNNESVLQKVVATFALISVALVLLLPPIKVTLRRKHKIKV